VATPPGTFAFTTPDIVPDAGTGPQSVTFTPIDTDNYNTASGSVELTVNAPEIAVEQPIGTDLTDGSASIDCGSSDVGSAAGGVTFTVKNLGTANLTGLAVTKDGSHSGDFTLGSLGTASLAPGASTTFNVTFVPEASGNRTATIHLASNDADEDPFDINLTGYGRTPLESWRFANFGIIENTGEALNTLDSDHDGFSNLMEYAFNMDPAICEKNPVGGQDTDASVSILYPRNVAATDLIFTIEESSDLGIADAWAPATVAEEVQSPVNGVEGVKATRTLLPGETRVFLRVRATLAP